MKKGNFGEMEAIVLTTPSVRPVLNPVTHEEDMHLSYDAQMQYRRKPPTTRLILCNSLDEVEIGGTVMVTYHSGMRAYQHNRHIVCSNKDNCVGGFYYTDGSIA